MNEQNFEFENQSLVQGFNGVLNAVIPGEEYSVKPPTGPSKELPKLSSRELAALYTTVFGEKLNSNKYSYQSIAPIIGEGYIVKDVPFPTANQLTDINICGIDASNQIIDMGSFYFIIARSSIVNFRYSKAGYDPSFYTKHRDASAVMVVDANIFDPAVLRINTGLDLDIESKNILKPIKRNRGHEPILVRYNPDSKNKSPSAHALGWAVKLQQVLELECLREVPIEGKTICIKDGPLFSTSVSIDDVVRGLSHVLSWEDKILIACSNKVRDSTLLIELLQQNGTFREAWFEGQNVTEDDIRSIGSDALLIPKILKPGQRTPLLEAVPRSRIAVVKEEPRFMPLTCYYYSRHRPHTFIRMEIPKFMWEQYPALVEEAITLVAWQHELGHKAPLVQMMAGQQCQLQSEKHILERVTLARLSQQGIEFPESY
jgi:hypothetical protein